MPGYDVRREDHSGLVLAHGVLTAQELASRAYLPRLVIVNACHSAATRDARLQQEAEARRVTRNLVTGVLGAGARAFVGAMWEVDDDAAATFATGLFETLLRDGAHGKCPIGDACARAAGGASKPTARASRRGRPTACTAAPGVPPGDPASE